nr:putative integron gene cassette protein [uncultured bacterium]
MDKTLSSSLSLLHKAVLKPAGFSKKAATFSRSHETHVELFNIQLSQWNSRSGRMFYVNCGLTFTGLPLEFPWLHFPGTQWAARIEDLVPEAPKVWQYSEDTVDTVLALLGGSILSASAHMAGNLAAYRQMYLARVERISLHRQAAKA